MILRLFPAFAGCLLLISSIAAGEEDRTLSLKTREGGTITATLLHISTDKVELRTDGETRTYPLDSFDPSELPLFHDFAEYQNHPFDINHLADPDPSIQPGKTVEIAMPGLEPDANGNPAGYTLHVPEHYHPWKPVPVLVWFSGWRGSRDLQQALPLVDPSEFLVVCMPYPESEPRPVLAVTSGRGSTRLWAYHQPMLEDLRKRVPNLSPDIRVVGGMSNGAHTIGSYLGEKNEAFASFFNAFVIVEGGVSVRSDFPDLKGKRVYLAWGAVGDGIQFAADLSASLKTAGAEVTGASMPAVGHDFPEVEKTRCRLWIAKLLTAAGKSE